MKKNQLRGISRVIRYKNNAAKKENGWTIYLRVNVLIDGTKDKFEVSTRQYFAQKKEWNKEAKTIRGNSDASRRIMKKVKDVEAVVEEVWEKLAGTEKVTVKLFQAGIYEAMGIEKQNSDKHTRITTVIPLVQHLLEMRKLDIGQKRRERYILLEERLRTFLVATYRTENVRLSELGPVFYNRYRNFLSEMYPIHKVSTLESQLKALKAVGRQAHMDGIISKNPFASCKSQKVEYEPRGLNIENFLKIQNCDDTRLTDDVLKVKKWFLILCNTGVAHADLKFVCSSIERAGEQFFLRGSRQKTNVNFNVWIRPAVITLLTELCKLENVKEFSALSVPGLDMMNARLKILAAVSGMKENLTTHMGRHTYATLYIRNGGSMTGLADNIGHRDLRQTRHYGRRDDETIINEAMTVYNNIQNRSNNLPKSSINMN